jgi:dipeptidase E
VDVSTRSMVPPRIGEDFVQWKPPTAGDETLGVVDFSIFPHFENPDLPTHTLAAAERWAPEIAGQAYAIDDQTAIKVVNGTVEVVSEGQWKTVHPQPANNRIGLTQRGPRMGQRPLARTARTLHR